MKWDKSRADNSKYENFKCLRICLFGDPMFKACKYNVIMKLHIQVTLVISNSRGLT